MVFAVAVIDISNVMREHAVNAPHLCKLVAARIIVTLILIANGVKHKKDENSVDRKCLCKSFEQKSKIKRENTTSTERNEMFLICFMRISERKV